MPQQQRWRRQSGWDSDSEENAQKMIKDQVSALVRLWRIAVENVEAERTGDPAAKVETLARSIGVDVSEEIAMEH